MGETEVTQEQWRAVMGNNSSRFKGAKNPVETVSWNECQEFVKKFNASLAAASAAGDALLKQRLNGFVASLPTEAQWEYACRAGTTTPFYFGFVLNKYNVNYRRDIPYGMESKSTYLAMTTQVGSETANAWGICDMHGNVADWCSDWYGNYHGAETDPAGAASGVSRAVRGGTWNSGAWHCRSAYRCGWGTSVKGVTPDFRNSILGLRLALVSEDLIVPVKKATSAEVNQ
jgi:formylglycine-generating enzyme required for sulfatase activity